MSDVSSSSSSPPSGELVEVWATDSTLLSFDGRVLEVFGFTETYRYHIALRPTITVGKGMVKISPARTSSYRFGFDESRRADLERFAALIASRHP